MYNNDMVYFILLFCKYYRNRGQGGLANEYESIGNTLYICTYRTFTQVAKVHSKHLRTSKQYKTFDIDLKLSSFLFSNMYAFLYFDSKLKIANV